MAENKTVAQAPTQKPTGKVITIDASKLPAGFDISKLTSEVITGYVARNERSAKYNEGRRKALSALADAHRPEYEALLKKFNPNGTK